MHTVYAALNLKDRFGETCLTGSQSAKGRNTLRRMRRALHAAVGMNVAEGLQAVIGHLVSGG